MPHQLTVLVTCKNERSNIEGCLASVAGLADEILIVDSGSTDGTLEYVRSRADCRLIERQYVTAGDIRNWAIPQANHPWVLLLDADERVGPELRAAIRTLLAGQPGCDGYWMRRRNYLMGHPLRHTNWGRDRALRLFRRDLASYDPAGDHVTARIAGGNVGLVPGVLAHFTIWSWEQWHRKMDRYAQIQAQAWFDAGRRPTYRGLMLRPLLRFLREYILFLGILDGLPGVQVAWSAAYYCFVKQAKLWELAAIRPQADVEREVLRTLPANRSRHANYPFFHGWGRRLGSLRRAFGLF